MRILIEKDSATKVPREVESLEEAKAFADRGFTVSVEKDGGYVPLADAILGAVVTAAIDAVETHIAGGQKPTSPKAAKAKAATRKSK